MNGVGLWLTRFFETPSFQGFWDQIQADKKETEGIFIVRSLYKLCWFMLTKESVYFIYLYLYINMYIYICMCIYIKTPPKKNNDIQPISVQPNHSEFHENFPPSLDVAVVSAPLRHLHNDILFTPKTSPDLVVNPGSVGSYRYTVKCIYKQM